MNIDSFESFQKIIKSKNLLKKYGFDKIGVFGSFARGEVANDIDIYLVDPITGFMADEVIPGKPYEANFNVLSGFVGNYKLIINYNGEQETLLSDTGSFTHEFVTGDIPSEMHFDLYKEGIHYGKIRIWIPVIT